MLRYAIVFLFLISPALGQDPASASIVAPKEVTGTGKRDDPFVFTSKTKCILKLSGVPEDAKPEWDLEDAPADIEPIGQALVFSLDKAGSFQAISKGPNYCRCWFQIKSGTDPPPVPPVDDDITKRVKAALAGNPVHARKYSEVWKQLADNMEAGAFAKQSQYELAAVAAMKAAGLVTGTYPDISKLGGELFNRGEKDWELTPADKADFTAKLRALSKAAAEVK